MSNAALLLSLWFFSFDHCRVEGLLECLTSSGHFVRLRTALVVVWCWVHSLRTLFRVFAWAVMCRSGAVSLAFVECKPSFCCFGSFWSKSKVYCKIAVVPVHIDLICRENHKIIDWSPSIRLSKPFTHKENWLAKVQILKITIFDELFHDGSNTYSRDDKNSTRSSRKFPNQV